MPFQSPEGKRKAGVSTQSLLQHCSFRAPAPQDRPYSYFGSYSGVAHPTSTQQNKLASEYYLPKSALLLQDFLLFAVCIYSMHLRTYCCAWERNCEGPGHASAGITGRRNMTTNNTEGKGDFFGRRRGGEGWFFTIKEDSR